MVDNKKHSPSNEFDTVIDLLENNTESSQTLISRIDALIEKKLVSDTVLEILVIARNMHAINIMKNIA